MKLSFEPFFRMQRSFKIIYIPLTIAIKSDLYKVHINGIHKLHNNLILTKLTTACMYVYNMSIYVYSMYNIDKVFKVAMGLFETRGNLEPTF